MMHSFLGVLLHSYTVQNKGTDDVHLTDGTIEARPRLKSVAPLSRLTPSRVLCRPECPDLLRNSQGSYDAATSWSPSSRACLRSLASRCWRFRFSFCAQMVSA